MELLNQIPDASVEQGNTFFLKNEQLDLLENASKTSIEDCLSIEESNKKIKAKREL